MGKNHTSSGLLKLLGAAVSVVAIIAGIKKGDK